MITALGSALLIWGSLEAAKKDSATVRDKLEEFSLKLDKARQPESKEVKPSGSVIGRIDKVENEFSAWAEEFTKQRHLKGLQFAQSRLGRRAVAAEVTAAWKPYLALILDTITGMIRAYNSKTSGAVKFDLPGIPDDLFASPYNGRVTWGPNAIWQLETECTQPARPLSVLTLRIYFKKNSSRMIGEAVVIIIGPKVFEVFAHGASVLVDVDRYETPIGEFEPIITHAVRQLVEAQLVELQGE